MREERVCYTWLPRLPSYARKHVAKWDTKSGREAPHSLGHTYSPLIARDYRIEDINKSCLEEFRSHWECLDNNNQQLWQCRPAEWKLNKCVFQNLVRLFPFPRSTLRKP